MRLSFTVVLLPAIVSALLWNAYPLGLNGIYPTQSYVSFDLDSPFVKITKSGDRCDSNGAHILLCPCGKMVPNPGSCNVGYEGQLGMDGGAIWAGDELPGADIQRAGLFDLLVWHK
jgi:hypothetical protein